MPRSSLKCFICVVLSVVALWLVALSNLTAQTTEGMEFRLVFQKNFRDSVADEKTDELRPAEPLKLNITITARTKASGYIESVSLGLHQPFTVEPGKVTTIPVDAALQLTSNGVVENKSLHVVADAPISVYAVNHRYQTTDTYLALPVDALGTTYRAMGYKWLADDLLSQFAVVATDDNTTVTITPSIETGRMEPAGVPFSITLNKGETYQVIPHLDPTREGDLTGSLIVSDKPVALFSGHNCAYVPERTWKACNLLVEQLPPVEAWGREFIIANFADRRSSVIRVVAHQEETEVFENGRKVATLSAGQFYENPDATTATVVTANKPILLAQFSKGFTARSKGEVFPDSTGDPMMILIPPTDQYLNSYRFATPFAGSWNHYVNVTATKEEMQRIRLDGDRIPAEKFAAIPGTNFLVAQIQVSEGSHVIEGKHGFGLYSYGFGYADKIFDAYGNNCGQGLEQRPYWIAEPKTSSISQTQSGKEKEKSEIQKADTKPAAPATTTTTTKAIETTQPVKVPPPQQPAEVKKNRPGIEYRKD